MKLSRLHENFIDSARRPMTFGKLPIKPKDTDAPVIPTHSWIKTDDNFLVKTFYFREKNLRNEFVKDLFLYESEVGHYARLNINADTVAIYLQTKDVQRITELDKEYSKYADELFKDVVYSQVHD